MELYWHPLCPPQDLSQEWTERLSEGLVDDKTQGAMWRKELLLRYSAL